MSSHVQELDDTKFDTFVQTHRAVLVDFWAAWCGPCKAIAPVVEAYADGHHHQIAVAKVDVDANPSLAGRYSIMSIPTLLVLVDGDVVARHVGAIGADRLEAFVDGVLAG